MFYTLKQLSKQLSIPVNKILKDLCIKHRKKFFYQHDLKWYEFPSNNDVIITKDYAQYYAKLTGKGLLALPSLNNTISNLSNFNDISENSYNTDSFPIPTIVLLGHYNHGKTTLLDSFNQTSYAKQEPHGITQMIRTKLISFENKMNFIENNIIEKDLMKLNQMTFIDTPGQDVFYRMRNYGAKIADIALLLIALDDGICIQTVESIGILNDLKIPIIVCINKIDLYPDNIIQKEKISKLITNIKEYECLENANIIEISASRNINIDKLIHQITYEYTTILSNNNKNNKKNNNNSMLKVKRILNSYYIYGIGVVLNIIKNKKYGTSLHVIIRYGEVKVGDYFSAGGWSGTIRNILIDYDQHDDTSCLNTAQHDSNAAVSLPNTSSNNSNTTSSRTNSNKSSSNISSTVTARKGHPVLVIVSLNRLISEPRPLGDFIYFHSHLPHNNNNIPTSLNNNPKNDREQVAGEVVVRDKVVVNTLFYQSPKEASEYLMEQSQFENRIEQAIVTDELVQKYRLNQRYNALKHQKLGLKDCDDMTVQEDHNTGTEESIPGNDDDSNDSVTTIEEEESDVGDSSEKSADLYIVKCDSDIAMSTLYDAYMDMVEHAEEQRLTQRGYVIYWNIGELSISDVLLAKEGNAKIITYNIKIDHVVMKKAKELGIVIQSYSNIPEIVHIVTNLDH